MARRTRKTRRARNAPTPKRTSATLTAERTAAQGVVVGLRLAAELIGRSDSAARDGLVRVAVALGDNATDEVKQAVRALALAVNERVVAQSGFDARAAAYDIFSIRMPVNTLRAMATTVVTGAQSINPVPTAATIVGTRVEDLPGQGQGGILNLR